ncbi:MAG: hypothetical protein UR28_C0001G0040 [Candidatus Peregrinibacteria bacterium GW2011_GWF2_33_10]|nr:MAG: hypothetical protein UR28_C0001G0040 [Candidatus Peregrinibacteria bacterium GW2011_GWF2_33_10]OGJ44788.1 MAG: hypothetical protein A2263_06135 [Candidatus Peregrinibacteria bacterium RIFOXYA2_FULL_33_21]OGJ46550.1 MAG: hypothetical protein A2272_01525 [Candidatus Peregrinibacteria bacterium RIFOXYA12_FULL_33_12]OGJ50474.1 MAG: hypothetical protein A2307_02760 [Candidatus Peregrinibacteria bacterium RIFOXYB2_FULL_33_20]
METLSPIIHFIDQKKVEFLSAHKYEEMRRQLLVKLQELDSGSYEEIARINYYILMLGLRYNYMKLDEADRLYELIDNAFLQEEAKIKDKLNKADKKDKHTIHLQLGYFYKMAQHYLDNLENLFRAKYFFDHSKKAYTDKLRFRASQKLHEHKLLDFFEYKREELTNRFRTHYLLYTLFGGIGMIIFWRGIWDLTYNIPIVRTDLGAIIIGLFIMTVTGFMASLGDRSIISTTDKFEE